MGSVPHFQNQCLLDQKGRRKKTQLSSCRGHVRAFCSFICKSSYNNHNFRKYLKPVCTYIIAGKNCFFADVYTSTKMKDKIKEGNKTGLQLKKTEVSKCCDSSKKFLLHFTFFSSGAGETVVPTEEVKNCATDWYEHKLSSYTCWSWRPEGRETISIVIHGGKIHLKSSLSVFGWKPIVLQTGRLFSENTVACCIH